jgi:flagellar biosynthetic protein FlhB
MSAQKTEQPTKRRIDDARKRGQVAHSREVDSAIVLLAAFGVMRFGGAAIWNGLQSIMIDSFSNLNKDPLNTPLSASIGSAVVGRAVLLLLPLLGTIAALSIAAGVGQTGGPLFAAEAVKPQLSRISPLAGAKRLFASKQSWVTLAKSMGKFIVLGGVAALAVRARWSDITGLGVAYSLPQSLGLLVDIGFQVSLQVMLAVLGLAAADFIFQRFDFVSQLRMSRQEVKDEMKQTEGDPAVKAQLARMRRSFLARVMQSVPKADVILVNPTHYAVALKYDAATSTAPIVLAKGTGLMAQRIREIAEEHRIPIISNPPLTRAIYKAVDVGREITPELYEAVAEILAFVYRLRTGVVAARA